MGFAATLRKHNAAAKERANTVVRETVREFGGRLVEDWTPFGNPDLWKSPPPADYRPGNLRSSWFFSVGRPSSETTSRVDIRSVNGLDQMGADVLGQKLYLANSAAHVGAIEAGHSSQAPVGIMWSAAEFEPLVRSVNSRVKR